MAYNDKRQINHNTDLITRSNDIVATEENFQSFLGDSAIMAKIQSQIEKGFDPERLRQFAFLAVTKNKKLLQCTKESIINALCECASLGIEPRMGRCHLIPFNEFLKDENGKVVTDANGNWLSVVHCECQIGYQGFIELAYRSGQMTGLKIFQVMKDDTFEIRPSAEPPFIHEVKNPAYSEVMRRQAEIRDVWRGYRKEKDAQKYQKKNERKELDRPSQTLESPWLYYCYATFKSCPPCFVYMTADQIEMHRWKYSKSPTSPAWEESYDAMAFKTVIKMAATKRWPLTVMPELKDAIERDMEKTDTLDVVDNEIIDVQYESDGGQLQPHENQSFFSDKREKQAQDLFEQARNTTNSGLSITRGEMMYDDITREIRGCQTRAKLKEIGEAIRAEGQRLDSKQQSYLGREDVAELREAHLARRQELIDAGVNE